MSEGYHSLMANRTLDLVPLLKGQQLVRFSQVYRTKYGPNGIVNKHKV